MGPKIYFVDFKSCFFCLFLRTWLSFQHLVAGNKCNGNMISTFLPCYAFQILTELFHWERVMVKWNRSEPRCQKVVMLFSKILYLQWKKLIIHSEKLSFVKSLKWAVLMPTVFNLLKTGTYNILIEFLT